MILFIVALLTHPFATMHAHIPSFFSGESENSTVSVQVPDTSLYLFSLGRAAHADGGEATLPQEESPIPAETKKTRIATLPSFLHVPFFSQFKDITSPKWQKVGCGVASLAMLIEYYKPGTVILDTLLDQGVKAGAYLDSAGWTYNGLITLSRKYGLDGASYDLGKSTSAVAFTAFKEKLASGPVIASVHYQFDPQSTIPHLVVINGIKNDTLYYNDPAAKSGEKQISTEDFLKAWKKRFIVVRPVG